MDQSQNVIMHRQTEFWKNSERTRFYTIHKSLEINRRKDSRPCRTGSKFLNFVIY